MEKRKSTAIMATDLMKSQLQRQRHLRKDDDGTDLMVIKYENLFDLARMRHLMVIVMTVWVMKQMTILFSGASDGLLLNIFTTFLVGNWA